MTAEPNFKDDFDAFDADDEFAGPSVFDVPKTSAIDAHPFTAGQNAPSAPPADRPAFPPLSNPVGSLMAGVENGLGEASVPRLSDQVHHVLGVAERGEVEGGGDHHVVGAEDRLPHPSRPEVRQIEHDVGRRAADLAQHLLEGFRPDLVIFVERRRRSEQRQPIGATRGHAIQKSRVEAVGLVQRVAHALHRVLVEIQPRGAER
jgi:hypothetical protein